MARRKWQKRSVPSPRVGGFVSIAFHDFGLSLGLVCSLLPVLAIAGCSSDSQCPLTGMHCSSSGACVCRSGFTGGNGKEGCRDINECLSSCSAPASNCTNTAGGFLCACVQGYKGTTQDAMHGRCRFSSSTASFTMGNIECSCKYQTRPASLHGVLDADNGTLTAGCYVGSNAISLWPAFGGAVIGVMLCIAGVGLYVAYIKKQIRLPALRSRHSLRKGIRLGDGLADSEEDDEDKPYIFSSLTSRLGSMEDVSVVSDVFHNGFQRSPDISDNYLQSPTPSCKMEDTYSLNRTTQHSQQRRYSCYVRNSHSPDTAKRERAKSTPNREAAVARLHSADDFHIRAADLKPHRAVRRHSSTKSQRRPSANLSVKDFPWANPDGSADAKRTSPGKQQLNVGVRRHSSVKSKRRPSMKQVANESQWVKPQGSEEDVCMAAVEPRTFRLRRHRSIKLTPKPVINDWVEDGKGDSVDELYVPPTCATSPSVSQCSLPKSDRSASITFAHDDPPRLPPPVGYYQVSRESEEESEEKEEGEEGNYIRPMFRAAPPLPGEGPAATSTAPNHLEWTSLRAAPGGQNNTMESVYSTFSETRNEDIYQTLQKCALVDHHPAVGESLSVASDSDV